MLNLLFLFLLFGGQNLKIIRSDAAGIDFVYTTPQLKLIDGKIYIDNTSIIDVDGAPQLPVKYVWLGIPLGAKVEPKVLAVEEEKIDEVEIEPNPTLTENGYKFIKNKSIYSLADYYPKEIIKVESRGYLRNQEVVKLRIAPVRYNPSTKTLIFYKKLILRINFQGGGKGYYSADYFENTFKRLLLNYEEAKGWRRIHSAKRYRRLNRSAPWYKINIVEEGLYKITYEDLVQLGISPDSIDPNTIKIYNGGSKILIDYTDTLKEIPIYVNTNGLFDEHSYIIFYGTPLYGWGKNDQTFFNPYTDTNVYWLTFGTDYGRRDSIKGDFPGIYKTVSYFQDTIHIEQDNLCPAKAGLAWIWNEIRRYPIENEVTKAYKFLLHGVASDSCEVNVSVNGPQQLLSGDWSAQSIVHNIKLYLNDELFSDTTWKGGDPINSRIIGGKVSSLKDGENVLTLILYKREPTDTVDIIYFDYFEIIYNRRYEAYDGKLKFHGNGQSDTIEFNISGFTSSPYVFDISDPLNPKIVTGTSFDNGKLTFEGLGTQTYYAACKFKMPVSMQRKSPYNLREWNDGAEYLIITTDELIPYARRLADYREEYGLITKVINIEDIYNNFAWGLREPIAIKNFLRFAYENYEIKPCFCLLFGAGTYAYKEAIPKNKIPPYENRYALGEYSLMYSFYVGDCYDDWYVDWYGYPQLPIGRITVRSANEASSIVDKLIGYEKTHGPWRKRVLLIADDEYDGPGNYNESMHVQDTEYTFLPLIPSDYDVFKVYLMNYRGINQSDPGWSPSKHPGYKPGARNDIVRLITKGVVFGSFMGHGWRKWLTHEEVFKNPSDIDALGNGKKLPLFFFGSCGVGNFERPDEESLADYFQKAENKGAIATLAPTRVASVSANRSLGIALFKGFFHDTTRTMGEVIWEAKLRSNYVNYQFFGDPATQILRYLEKPMIYLYPSDSLIGGAPITISGTAPFSDGFAHITGFSSTYLDSHDYTHRGGYIKYMMRGKILGYINNEALCKDIIFEGLSTLSDSHFSQTFVVPQGIDYGKNARISVCVWSENEGGIKAIDSLIVGIDDTTKKDTTGPTIELFVNNVRVEESSLVPRKFTLSGVVEDSNGIYAIKDQRYEPSLIINQDFINPVWLADHFSYDVGSKTRGSFSYNLNISEEDSATLLVRVYDNFLNSTNKKVILKFIPTFPGELSIKYLKNSPNPVRKYETTFSFYLSKRARITLKIYTVTGRLIKVIEHDGMEGYNRIPWDTRDELGDLVGSGVYLYKVKAVSEEMLGSTASRQTQSKIGKLMIIR